MHPCPPPSSRGLVLRSARAAHPDRRLKTLEMQSEAPKDVIKRCVVYHQKPPTPPSQVLDCGDKNRIQYTAAPFG